MCRSDVVGKDVAGKCVAGKDVARKCDIGKDVAGMCVVAKGCRREGLSAVGAPRVLISDGGWTTWQHTVRVGMT